MLIEIDSKTYNKYFPLDPHPFISERFIELNKGKVDKVIRLVEKTNKPGLGLVAGVKDGFIKSPFSAPFGGFHFRHEVLFVREIVDFIYGILEFIKASGLKGIEITLPPCIYHETLNAKLINALLRIGFHQPLPDITNWIDLSRFEGKFTRKNSKEYYRQSIKNGLSFNSTSDEQEKLEIYNLIRENREKYGRPIFMTYNEVINTGDLWPVDFFKVTTLDSLTVASAIFYRYHPQISYAVFWGDNEIGRTFRAMDFLAFNLYAYYKNLEYRYIDLGISTEEGIPNEGLLRFKESHEAISSLRYKFYWKQIKG